MLKVLWPSELRNPKSGVVCIKITGHGKDGAVADALELHEAGLEELHHGILEHVRVAAEQMLSVKVLEA